MSIQIRSQGHNECLWRGLHTSSRNGWSFHSLSDVKV